jgi:hemoglobin
MTDIVTREDIKLMVDTFYGKVQQNAQLDAVFNGFANVDWGMHLPKMYAFWEKMLFGTGGYSGRPFDPHVPLPVDGSHFEQWVDIFETNMDEHFDGPMAEHAKTRAKSIAQIFENKLAHLHKQH